MQYGRVDNLAGKESAPLEICLNLMKAGAPVETFMTEFAEAQYEITFCPEEGVTGADTVVMAKEALRHEMKRQNARVQFMAHAEEAEHSSGFHFNHSLWTGDGRNAFLDESDPAYISDVARHWMAGLIHHSRALTAIYCPTVNCFRRLESENLIAKCGTWGTENRLVLLRLKNENKNVYIENRLPSSACNPYLSMAATVAAGLDGLARKLECPPEKDFANAPVLPKTFPEALSCLEMDTYLREALGEKLVEHFLRMSHQLWDAKLNGSLSTLEDERALYFHII